MTIFLNKRIAFFSLLIVLLVFPALKSANAQLSDCNCNNSSDSTCADGFEVTFLGATNGNTVFTYSVCNVDTEECNAPMGLSHADIIISNSLCINDPGSNITSTFIGTNNTTEIPCEAPTNRDPSCQDIPDPLPAGLLIKCEVPEGNDGDLFDPAPGQCVTIEIEILNANPPLQVGPTVALNKAGQICGNGCLLGPSCVGCEPPPPASCDVTVIKELNGSDGPATFGMVADYDGPSDDFNIFLTPPNTPSINFDLPLGEGVTVTENDMPDGWTFNNVSCIAGPGTSCDDEIGGQAFFCECGDDGDGSATCTFNNNPPLDLPCNIEIVKQTNPNDDPQSFSFTSNQTPAMFSLQDNGNQALSSIDVGVIAGVQETLPMNWVLDSINCIGGNPSQFDVILQDQQVNITCDSSSPGVARTCTFNNRFDPPPPGSGCCIESQGICFADVSENDCPVPPNEAFLLGQSCVDPRCETPPPGEGCCVETEAVCSITTAENCPVPPNLEFLGIGSNCTDQNICNPIPPISSVPTLSQWGLIAMAGILGLVGFIMVIRRQAAA